MRRLRILALAACLAAPVGLGPPPRPALADCALAIEFQRIHDAIPDVSGECVEDAHREPSLGDVVQATGNGLFVQRAYDGVALFTDDQTSWLWTDCGVLARPADARFDWEAGRTPSCHTPLAAIPKPYFVLNPPRDIPSNPSGLFDPRAFVGQGDAFDCTDFSFVQAQAVLAADPGDPNKLDDNHNGVACEAGEGRASTTRTR
jgi:hypothetical protein